MRMDLNNIVKKENKYIKCLTALCFSIFTSIVTTSMFVIDAADTNIIISVTILVSIVYFIITMKLIKYYNELLYYLVYRFTNHKMKYHNNFIPKIWLMPSIIALLLALYFFIKSNTYMNIAIDTSQFKVNYDMIRSLRSRFIPLASNLFLLFGIILQSISLRVIESIKTISSIIISFVSVCLSGLIFVTIMVIISTILAGGASI